MDINADGLGDLAFSLDPDDLDSHWSFMLNNGAGFNAPVALTDHDNDLRRLPAFTSTLVRFEDMNGDGFPDLIYPSAIKNQGAEWKIIYYEFDYEFGLEIDHEIDYELFRLFAKDHVSRNLKLGYVDKDQNAESNENDTSIFVDFTGNGKLDQLFLNFNSSGEVLNTDSGLYKGRNVFPLSSDKEASNVIESITNGLGAKTELSYLPLTDTEVYTRLHDAVGVRGEKKWGYGSVVYDLVAPVYVVSAASSIAPIFPYPSNPDDINMSSVYYHYVGAKMQGGGRGFLGFGEVISYDTQLGIRTNTRYRQDFPFIGLPVDTMRAKSTSRKAILSDPAAGDPPSWESVSNITNALESPSGTRIFYAINEWAAMPTASRVLFPDSDAVFPYIANSLEFSYTLSGIFEKKVHTNNNYDTYGNLTSSTVGTYETDDTTPFAEQTTNNTYSDDVGAWHLGRLVTSSVTHKRGSNSTARKSGFAYHPINGILIKEVIEPDPENEEFRITTDYELDSFGNRKKTTVTGYDMNPRVSDHPYDSLGRFIISKTNFLGQTTYKVNSWDVYGNPTLTEDIEGVFTSSSADHMGRPFVSFIGKPGSEQSNSWTGEYTKTSYSYNTESCPEGTAFKATTSSGGKPTQFQCMDVLGRVIRTAVVSFSGTYIYTDQYYDSSGRAVRVSEPYFSSDSAQWNTTGYDAFSRVTYVDSATGADQSFDYDSDSNIQCETVNVRVTQITNGLGQKRVETRNALGEITKVYDDDCEVVSYSYDAVGNLTGVTGADSESVSMTYDPAGRKTTMEDPDKGDWEYDYNALGEMTRQLDSKDQAIDFTYDKLSRVITRRELDGVDSLSDSSFTVVNKETTSYKTSGNGKGQIGSVTYRTGESGAELHSKTFNHDSFGRVISVVTGIGTSENYLEETTYDQYGRVFQQFDASGDDHGIRYFYTNGYVSKLKEAREGTAGAVYQDILAMDARSNVTYMELNNGRVEVYPVYDDTTGQLDMLTAYDQNGVGIQEIDYLFDVLGNLKKRHDLSDAINLKETFIYDDLNRLDTVNLAVNGTASVATLELDYDVAGNITYKSDVGIYLYEGSQPHAVTSAGGVAYNYDANGNQTSGDGRSITYTVFDKPDSISKGGDQVLFKYGVGNSRYQREDYIDDGSGGLALQKTTKYLGSVERITEGSSTYYKRYLGGVAIATYYPSTGVQQIAYLLKDHTGSIHTVLDQNGLITARMHFSAFGERQDITDWQSPISGAQYALLNDMTTRGFTGHEQVDSMSIIHMNGRIYDPKLGRFLQADPFVQSPKNSQSLNRYSYVLNNPLSYTDPSGYFFKELFNFVAAVVRVVATEGADPTAWVQLAIAGKSLFNAMGSQQSGLPTGVVASAFMYGVNIATSFDTGGVRHGSIQESGSPVERVRLATIGGTGSDQTGWKFANGAGSAGFVYVVATSVNVLTEYASAGAKVLKNSKNYGSGKKLLGGKVIVRKHGSPQSVVTATELATVKNSLDQIAKSGGANGKSFINALNTNKPLEIILNSSGGNTAYRGLFKMTVDLSTHINIRKPLSRMGITRLIAHEGAHAVLGYSDWPYSLNTTVNFVDGIMKGINGSVRGDYYNVCHPGNC